MHLKIKKLQYEQLRTQISKTKTSLNIQPSVHTHLYKQQKKRLLRLHRSFNILHTSRCKIFLTRI